MFQISIKPYASDALDDAMNLAQVKAMNSFSFSDCFNYLNYSWADIYKRMACIDDGFYSVTVRVGKKLTRLPAYVANTVCVYRAQSPAGFNRLVYRDSGPDDLSSPGTYSLQGFDLYVPDAERTTVWLRYVPACPMLFFTLHNRDPKIYAYDDETNNAEKVNSLYNLYKLQFGDDTSLSDVSKGSDYSSATKYQLTSRASADPIDISKYILKDGYKVVFLTCDYPYIFVSYKNTVTGEYLSGFIHDKDFAFNEYNPFAFTGRTSNVRYLRCSWNDKTGMGVVFQDWNDEDESYGTVTIDNVKYTNPPYTIKEMGWTPDTLMNYPAPEMYRYLVARLADKFSALNESNVMGVQKELLESKNAFEAFLAKDKSSWKRITNVNGPTITDWL